MRKIAKWATLMIVLAALILPASSGLGAAKMEVSRQNLNENSLSMPASLPGEAMAANGLAGTATVVVTGRDHTCALTNAGGVKCWGNNYYGQLGDGSTNTRAIPMDVDGLSSGVVAIAAGYDHTCAVTGSGGAKCWGRNEDGQLGDGTTTNRYTPVNVSGLGSGVAAISAGGHHTCALTSGGGVKCWGGNTWGQLGDGTNTQRLTSVNVSDLSSGVAAITAEGEGHTCAVTSGGGVKCWGFNGYGQLGDGTKTDRWTPVNVSDLSSGVAAIAAGWAYTCALTNSGGAKCWGDNSWGQLGDGTTTQRLTPANVSGLSSGVASISAGKVAHTCAVTSGGGAKCWGYNEFGQLGSGLYLNSLTPVNVSGLSSETTAIDAGGSHSCALLSNNGVKCWGYNDSGQLGNGSYNGSNTPVNVVGLEGEGDTWSVYLPLVESWNPLHVFGTGADGDLFVGAGETVYVNQVRSALEGAAHYAENFLTVTDASNFAPGDEVMIVQLEGFEAGDYEFKTIISINGNTLTLDKGLEYTYQSITPKVTLYSDANYSGNSVTYSSHVADLNGSPVGNDAVSSLQLPHGTGVLLYRDSNFGGVGETFTVDDPNLSDNIIGDNTVTSLRVSSTQKAQVVRVPHYENVTVQAGGILGADTWSNATNDGGVIVFRVRGTLQVDGAILASSVGFKGGDRGHYGNAFRGHGWQGQSYYINYEGIQSTLPNNGGGGGGQGDDGSRDVGAGGGGGGYGTSGTNGVAAGTPVSQPGTGGETYGSADLTARIYFGSGGGGGGSDNNDAYPGGYGGNGGGIVVIAARTIDINGSISAHGQNGFNGDSGGKTGGGGGGSGGSIFLLGQNVDLGSNKVQAVGGSGGLGQGVSPKGGDGGAGGYGRIHIQYWDSLAGSTTPAAYAEQVIPGDPWPRLAQTPGSPDFLYAWAGMLAAPLLGLLSNVMAGRVRK